MNDCVNLLHRVWVLTFLRTYVFLVRFSARDEEETKQKKASQNINLVNSVSLVCLVFTSIQKIRTS